MSFLPRLSPHVSQHVCRSVSIPVPNGAIHRKRTPALIQSRQKGRELRDHFKLLWPWLSSYPGAGVKEKSTVKDRLAFVPKKGFHLQDEPCVQHRGEIMNLVSLGSFQGPLWCLGTFDRHSGEGWLLLHADTSLAVVSCSIKQEECAGSVRMEEDLAKAGDYSLGFPRSAQNAAGRPATSGLNLEKESVRITLLSEKSSSGKSVLEQEKNTKRNVLLGKSFRSSTGIRTKCCSIQAEWYFQESSDFPINCSDSLTKPTRAGGAGGGVPQLVSTPRLR